MKDTYKLHIPNWELFSEEDKKKCKRVNEFRDGMRMKPVIHPSLIGKYGS